MQLSGQPYATSALFPAEEPSVLTSRETEWVRGPVWKILARAENRDLAVHLPAVSVLTDCAIYPSSEEMK
jgi:hypothetical protein